MDSNEHIANASRWESRPKKITLTARGSEWLVDLSEGDSVWPTTTHDSAMAACARVLQLLGLDMVAAQQHPERVEISPTGGGGGK